MNIKIEKAKKSDLNTILNLYTELTDFHKKLSNYYISGKEVRMKMKKLLLKRFGKSYFRIITASTSINNKKKIIGYFTGEIHEPKIYCAPKKIGRIGCAYVSREYRHNKIGEKLFKELLRWFKKKGIKHIEVETDSTNEIGLGAWKKYGFREYHKIMKMKI